MGGDAVAFVGGEEVRHDAFEPEGRLGPEAREEWGKVVEADALAAHAGIDFKVNGKGASAQPGGVCGGFKIVELRGLPGDGCEVVLDDGRGLAGKDAGDDQHARIGAESARGDAFFDTGDAEPAGAGANDRGSAESERVAVGVGLDDGEEFGVGCGEAEESGSCLRGRGCESQPSRGAFASGYPVFKFTASAGERSGHRISWDWQGGFG